MTELRLSSPEATTSRCTLCSSTPSATKGVELLSICKHVSGLVFRSRAVRSDNLAALGGQGCIPSPHTRPPRIKHVEIVRVLVGVELTGSSSEFVQLASGVEIPPSLDVARRAIDERARILYGRRTAPLQEEKGGILSCIFGNPTHAATF